MYIQDQERSKMFPTRNILKMRSQYRCFRTSAYPFSSSNLKDVKTDQKFKVKQFKMQANDEVPIFLRAGFRDKVLYGVTLGLMALQCFIGAQTIGELHKTYRY